MSSSVSNLQLLNNTEHRLKFKTGSDINNILNPAYSIQTDGGDDRLTATTAAFSSGDFTISMWVKLPTINHRSDMLIVNPSYRDIVIRARTDGFRFFFGGTSLMYSIGGATVTNKWYHLVWSHSGNTATAYIDGSAASHNFENNASVTLVVDPATLILSQSGYAGGLFGDVAIWNSALSASDVSKVYQEGVSSLVNKPINFWKMENTDLGYITDLGSGGNNLELTGGPVFSTDTPPTSRPTLKDPLVGELLFDKTDPALYACTDTSGTISKVSGNLAKMGDVPMLQLNDAGLTPTSSFTASTSHWGFSLWFWLREKSATNVGNKLFLNMQGTSGVYFETYSPYIYLRSFGYFDSAISNPVQWHHPDKVIPDNVSSKIPIEVGKLYNLTFLKKPSSTAGQDRAEIWLNGEIIAYNNNAGINYPSNPYFVSINPSSEDLSQVLFGDLAFWDQDISSITDRMHNPRGEHKGHQGDYMNLSIQPDHYYKLGSSFNDIGADGTKNLSQTSGGSYEYKNIFGIENP